ncbi:MAG: ribosome assembly RNA-binding protein YhbY [SAR324 cluster bacterium]|nr:ribosome assembly RNA-binding protein YhbY [SAR324 cluster bacterium]
MTKNQQALTGKQAIYLRGLGHSLKPLLQVGKAGITDSFMHQASSALETHELIKVKLIKSAPENVKEVAAKLSAGVPCQIAQTIGKTLLLYRQRAEDPTIVLPA